MEKNSLYTTETAGKIMAQNIPIVNPSDTVSEVIKKLAKESFDDVHAVYVLSHDKTFAGEIPIIKIFAAKESETVSQLLEKPKVTVLEKTDQEKVVMEAVKNDLKAIPVVDKENHLVGVITADTIIDVLHSEHLEDLLRSSGIRGKGSHIIELVTANFLELVRSRLPWLLTGLFLGFIISFFTSRYEISLRENISLVFFIPIITYISGAVSIQTETIFIRALTFLKINIINYIIREIILGMIIGVIIGSLTGFFAFILGSNIVIGLVVGFSLFLTVTTAVLLACIIPVILKTLGKDPAIGSGPFATALQDLLSIVIYLTIASIVL